MLFERYWRSQIISSLNEVFFTFLALNIRLSNSTNEGFIEIKNNLIWRKVKEEIWDKTRERSLCQHLGFNETMEGVVNNRGINNNQEIVGGDLCFDANQNERCCVHFYPSTTTSTVDAPYVTCE